MKLNTKLFLAIVLLYISTISCSCGHKHECSISENSSKTTKVCTHKHHH